MKTIFLASLIAIAICNDAAVGQETLSKSQAVNALSGIFNDRLRPEPWHCQVQIEGKQFYNNTQTEYAEAWEVWLQSEKLKAVPLQNNLNVPAFQWKSRTGSVASMCIGCYAPNTIVHFGLKYQDRSTETNSAISIYDDGISVTHLAIPDPRNIGLLPMDAMNTNRFFAYDPYEWQIDEISVERVHGTSDQWTITTGRPTFIGYGFTVRLLNGIVIPVQVKRSYIDKERAHSESIDVQYGLAENGDLIPQLSKYTNTVDGQVLAEESCTVTTITYGKAIADTVFTMKSMELPAGRSVNWGSSIEPPGDPGLLIFDGESIVERTVQGSIRNTAPASKWNSRAIFVLLNLTMLVVVVIYFVYRRSKNS